MGRIRVRGKITGRVGTISEENFDPNKYEELDETGQPLPAEQPRFLQNMATTLASPFVREKERVVGAAESVSRGLVASKAQRAAEAGENDEAIRLGELGSKPSRLTAPDQEYKKSLTDPLQLLKDSAAVLSWGGGVGTTGQLLKTGAAGGFGYSEAEDVGGLARDTALGAGTSVVAGKLLNKFFPGKAAKAAKKLTKVQEKAAEDFIQASPGQFAKAADHGIDLRKVLVDTMKQASDDTGKGFIGIDDLIGTIDDKNFGGAIANNIDDAEKIIRTSIDKNPKQVILLDDFIDDLIKTQDELSKGIANGAKVKELDIIIEGIRKQYPNGIQKGNSLDILRAANETFGDAVVKDTSGEINAQVNKRFANYIRKSLKGDAAVKSALRTQEENIILRNVLRTTRGKVSTKGFRSLGAIDISRPGSLVREILKSPKVASTIAKGRLTTGIGSGAPALETFLGSKVPVAAAGLNPLAALSGDAEATPPAFEESPLGDVATPQDSGSQDSGLGLTQQDLLLLSVLSKKEQEKILADIISDKLTGKTSASDKKRIAAISGADIVYNQIARASADAPSGLAGAFLSQAGRLPGVEGGSAEDLRRVTEGYARTIASAFAGEVGVATDRDVERWLGLMPKPGDTAAERQRALQRLKEQMDNEKARLGIL